MYLNIPSPKRCCKAGMKSRNCELLRKIAAQHGVILWHKYLLYGYLYVNYAQSFTYRCARNERRQQKRRLKPAITKICGLLKTVCCGSTISMTWTCQPSPASAWIISERSWQTRSTRRVECKHRSTLPPRYSAYAYSVLAFPTKRQTVCFPKVRTN